METDTPFKVMEDEANLYVEMQKAGINISNDKLKALLKSDFVPRYDPLANYFEGLPEWDCKINYIDKLATMNKTDINKLKSFISKDDDKNRRAYGRRSVRRIRRASFLASTNDTEFLTDTTGNVRWLCFLINGIKYDYKKDLNINDL